MNRLVTANVNGGTQKFALAFFAQTVTVDNPTFAWVYLPEANQFVAPNTIGNIIRYESGVSEPTLQFIAPPNIPVVSGAVGQVFLKFSDSSASPIPGTAIASPAPNNQVIIAAKDTGVFSGASPALLDLQNLITMGAARSGGAAVPLVSNGGDVIYLFVTLRNNAAAGPTVTTPTGWSVAFQTAAAVAAASASKSIIFAKPYRAGDRLVSIAFTNANEMQVQMLLIRNLVTTLPTQATGASTAVAGASAGLNGGATASLATLGGLFIYWASATDSTPTLSNVVVQRPTTGYTATPIALDVNTAGFNIRDTLVTTGTITRLENAPQVQWNFSANFVTVSLMLISLSPAIPTIVTPF